MEGLYPAINPYNEGFMDTLDGHRIYFEQSGNPNGFPILYIHGGPGAPCSPADKMFFNSKWRLITFDQRGCGNSIPSMSLEKNTTHDLLCDMFHLLRRLNIEKTVLFGGSWGSTLALLFAIHYPQMVSGLILRGIFLGEKDELDYLYNGEVKRFAPHHWERFIQNVPLDQRYRVLDFFYETMKNGAPQERRKLAFEMSRFEDALVSLEAKESDKIDSETSNYSYEACGLLEAHYFVNNCFIKEGFILKNVHHIPKVPISIVQGRYDLVCPPNSAYRLFKALSGADIPSDMYFVTAGHSKSDKEIMKKLISETNKIHKLVSRQSI